MTVRESLNALTTGCTTQVDLDRIVAKHDTLGAMMQTVCPGCDRGEFLYEWENLKLRIARTARRQRRDEMV